MNADVSPSGPLMYLRTSSQPPLPQAMKLRVGLVVLGLVLGLFGTWLLAADLLQQKTIELAQDRSSAMAASTYAAGSIRAAEVGLIRGELWAQAAFADQAVLWQQGGQAPANKSTSERVAAATSNMERALALAPIDGEGWLFLALMHAPSAADDRIATWLEMSYFTAPTALRLAPLRIERAAVSNALADKTIQELVTSDIRLILTYRAQLKASIFAAYRNARPQNQPVLESLVANIDPSLAPALRSGAVR